MAYQLLKGSLQHFLYAGLCHGMAMEDEHLVAFLKVWESGFLEFLEKLPMHFRAVMLVQRDLGSDPWALRTMGDRDPEFDEGGLISVSAELR
jgi:hypothetical protein